MQKVIDGKLYDTEKAENIAMIGNEKPPNDFTGKSWCKILYRTTKGSWFTWACGGKRTLYRGHTYMKALSEEDAKQLLHKWNEIDLIHEHFPESIEEA